MHLLNAARKITSIFFLPYAETTGEW